MSASAHEITTALATVIGKRVTIRLREVGGGFRDIVGVLKNEHQLINSKSEEISFSVDQIAIWREIKPLPDLAGKGAPLSQRIMELEKLSDLTWPAAKNIEYGKWRLRISDGFTMRANSALPTGPAPYGEPPVALDTAVKYVINIYRENNLTPTFTYPFPMFEQLDDYLAEKGWKLKIAANFLIRDIGELPQTSNLDFKAEILDYPSQQWLQLQSDQPLEKLMQRYPARYAEIKLEDKTIAVGRIATSGTWALVTRLFVDPSHRGQGVAKLIMNKLMATAKSDGATKVGLQVDQENGAALALYQAMGFRPHHQYFYRTLELDSGAQ